VSVPPDAESLRNTRRSVIRFKCGLNGKESGGVYVLDDEERDVRNLADMRHLVIDKSFFLMVKLCWLENAWRRCKWTRGRVGGNA
jgi:hypothetical protein